MTKTPYKSSAFQSAFESFVVKLSNKGRTKRAMTMVLVTYKTTKLSNEDAVYYKRSKVLVTYKTTKLSN